MEEVYYQLKLRAIPYETVSPQKLRGTCRIHNVEIQFEILSESDYMYYRFKYGLTEVIIRKPRAEVQKNFATIMSVLPTLIFDSDFSEAREQHSN